LIHFFKRFASKRKMPVCDWEKTITCPYNPAHQITEGRIQFHLVKCRKNHPSSDHVVCPYNASHHIPKPEEQHHMSTCPDRKIVELAKYSWALEKPGHHGNLSLPPQSNINWGNNASYYDDEDWESEATVKQSYDPKKSVIKKPVLRYLQGATISERNEFRAQEKARLDQIHSKDKMDENKNDPATQRENISSGQTTLQRGEGSGSATVVGALRRPSSSNLGDGSTSRSGSVTSTLLANMGRGIGQVGSRPSTGPLRRPGSILEWRDSWSNANVSRDICDFNNELDVTLETNDGTSSLDQTLSGLVLGRGRGYTPSASLRRPTDMDASKRWLI